MIHLKRIFIGSIPFFAVSALIFALYLFPIIVIIGACFGLIWIMWWLGLIWEKSNLSSYGKCFDPNHKNLLQEKEP